MMDLIENGMIIGAQRAWDAMYETGDTPWDHRTAWHLWQFVYDHDLEDAIRLENLDEDDVDTELDDLPDDVALR